MKLGHTAQNQDHRLQITTRPRQASFSPVAESIADGNRSTQHTTERPPPSKTRPSSTFDAAGSNASFNHKTYRQ